MLKALLAGGAEGKSAPVDAAYVTTALRRLTAQETVLIMEWADVARDPCCHLVSPRFSCFVPNNKVLAFILHEHDYEFLSKCSMVASCSPSMFVSLVGLEVPAIAMASVLFYTLKMKK